MISCKEYQQMCNLVLDGMLSDAESDSLKAHVRTCATCRAYLEDLIAMRDLWASSAQEMPDDLHENIMAAVNRERNIIIQKPNKIARPRFIALIGVAACLALVLSGSLGNMIGKNVGADRTIVAESDTPMAMAQPSATEAPAVTVPRVVEQAPMLAQAPAADPDQQDRAAAPQIFDMAQFTMPESLHTLSFADAFLVQGITENPLPELFTLVESTEEAQFYSTENSTATQEKAIALLGEQGYLVTSAENVALPLTREGERLLWIVCA